MTDRPVTIPVAGAPDWEPKNFERGFQGNMVLKTAMTRSVNTIAAQLVQLTGPDAVIQTATKCGIDSPLQDVFSIALGTAGVTPLEMAAAFSVFASLGNRHDPFLFWRVEDAYGRVLFEHIVQAQPVLDPATAYQVVDMMKAVVDTGSGRRVRDHGFTRPCAGKTGTSSNYMDAWFTGFTPALCTSVWIGFDRQTRLTDKHGIGITGGRGAAPIWARFMRQAVPSMTGFPVPGSLWPSKRASRFAEKRFDDTSHEKYRGPALADSSGVSAGRILFSVLVQWSLGWPGHDGVLCLSGRILLRGAQCSDASGRYMDDSTPDS
jgi:penicillin-binding protein 1A